MAEPAVNRPNLLAKTVVLVGGGFANMLLLRKLLKHSNLAVHHNTRPNIVLVDPKDGFFYSVGAPR
jgi:NADH dehydrogenase FAD-containing subunit